MNDGLTIDLWLDDEGLRGIERVDNNGSVLVDDSYPGLRKIPLTRKPPTWRFAEGQEIVLEVDAFSPWVFLLTGVDVRPA